MPRDALILKIQRELCHPKSARKVSRLSRNRPLAPARKQARVGHIHPVKRTFCGRRKGGSQHAAQLHSLIKAPVWRGWYLDGWPSASNFPVLYSLGSQAGVVDINHAFHLYYKHCMWVAFQLISTWLRGFSLGTPVSCLRKIDSHYIGPHIYQ